MNGGNLILVIGPPAVGKMTVAKHICDRLDYRLFHNHMSIELALEFFEFGTPAFIKLSDTIRETVFETVADSDHPGLVFTFVWAFNLESDQQFIKRTVDNWRTATAGSVYFLELAASLAARLERNKHPTRLAAKPSKRDTACSEENLHSLDAQYQMNTADDFPLDAPHMKIDNTSIPPQTVCDQFLAQVGLSPAAP